MSPCDSIMVGHKSLFISQKWIEGSGTVFSSHNPATGERVWQGKSASLGDVDAAVLSAQGAFQEWADLTVEERFSYLSEFSRLLKSSHHSLAEIISKETGKPLWDSKGEVEAMINKAPLSFEAYQKRCEELVRGQPPSIQ